MAVVHCILRKGFVIAATAVAFQFATFHTQAQSSTDCTRVKRLGMSLCHYCQEADKDVTNAWKKVFGTFAHCQQCLNKLCGNPDIEPRTAAPEARIINADASQAEHYCGLAPESQWVTLQHVSADIRIYRQAATVNPYAAIALFSARTELSTETEPNRFSLNSGTLVLERSFTMAETIRGIEAEVQGRPLRDLGSPLPPNSFITVVSERAAELDNPVTGEPGGFRVSAYLENTEGNRTLLGESAIALVDPPQKLTAGTGESVDVFTVREVVAAPRR